MRRATQALGFGVLVASMPLVVPGTGGAASSRHSVTIVDFQYDPKELTVEVGREVTWTNKDRGQVHSGAAEDGSFDSSPECSDANPGVCLDNRDQFKWTFEAPGTFPYYSRTNGAPGGQGTAGVITVVDPAAPPESSTPPTETTPPETSPPES